MNTHTYTTLELTAPSHWASYLINGDASGLEPEEKELADRWIQLNRMGEPVSCEDAGFHWKHGATALGVGGADCQTYIFLVPEHAHARDETFC